MPRTFNFIRKSSMFSGGHFLLGSFAGYAHIMGGPINGYITFYAILYLYSAANI